MFILTGTMFFVKKKIQTDMVSTALPAVTYVVQDIVSLVRNISCKVVDSCRNSGYSVTTISDSLVDILEYTLLLYLSFLAHFAAVKIDFSN